MPSAQTVSSSRTVYSGIFQARRYNIEIMLVKCCLCDVRQCMVEIISIIYLNEIQKTKSMALAPSIKMQQDMRALPSPVRELRHV